MKKIVNILLLILLLASCSNNKNEQENVIEAPKGKSVIKGTIEGSKQDEIIVFKYQMDGAPIKLGSVLTNEKGEYEFEFENNTIAIVLETNVHKYQRIHATFD